jgi:serine/threonine protein phosphatase PrpC
VELANEKGGLDNITVVAIKLYKMRWKDDR